ncbi:nutrient deprivation-induced protein [Pseudorhizobium endolithicum]|uniref:Nutrient deprivation-induced protein n=1 Tax=Pseudorhizobium endolithicum TaxID=1191678 RepID=A0ABN7JW60_9HYPH|nr:nutrient deprivation-induced protein [Pseudorhizobium endolithicum]CAD7051161.1 nutrient deprivation-induced protein [Pseudorhizobium endolithicum]
MTEHDPNRGDGYRPGSTYAAGGNPAREGAAPELGRAASETARSATSTAQGAGGSLKERASEDWQAVKSMAQDELGHATGRAKEAAEGQKTYAAERLGGLATAMQKVGDELAQGDQPEVGRYAKQIGDSIQRLAGDIKGKEMGEIAAMAEDFGRRQPAAFLGIAALAGFAASRFLTASADRRQAGASPTDGVTRASASPRSADGVGTTSTAASPVSPATGAGYATSYTPEGRYNG